MKLHPPATLAELLIPEDAQPTKAWSGQMLEMAAHIGPYATLMLLDRLGGQWIYVPSDPAQNRMEEVIGPEKTAIMSKVYGGERIDMPTGRDAIAEAKRGPIIAAIRAGQLTIAETVPILRVKRATISRWINHSDEGCNDRPMVPVRHRAPDPRQLDMFAE